MPTRVSKLAGRQGVFTAAFRDPNRDGRFQHNSHDVSELAFLGFFVGSRLFASVFGFCQRNDTRNDTRRDDPPTPSRLKTSSRNR